MTGYPSSHPVISGTDPVFSTISVMPDAIRHPAFKSVPMSFLDSGLRRNDGKVYFSTFYESVII
jgi:hypothetical protein